MAFVDDPNQKTENVAGAAPLSQGQATTPTQGESAAPSGDSSPSTIQASATPQAPKATNKSGKASSGMFTNIQNYVAKNQPQAQKMAQAATQDFTKQAGEIRKAAESKQQQQSAALQGNQAAIQESQNFAQQQVQNIMQPQETGVQAPKQEDAARFQDLMKGNIAGVNQVEDINLAEQKMKADVLGQMANKVRGEEGRRNLLQQTFQGKGPYSRGMSNLDQLITSGDKTAREQIIGGVQAAGEGLQKGLGDIQSQSRQALAAQQQQLGQFSGQVKDIADTALGQFSGLNETLEQTRTRGAELDAQKAAYDKLSGGIQSNIDQNQQQLQNLGSERDVLLRTIQNTEDYLNTNTEWETGDRFNTQRELEQNYELLNNLNSQISGIEGTLPELQKELETQQNHLRYFVEGDLGQFSSEVKGVQDQVLREQALRQLLGEQSQYDIQDLVKYIQDSQGS